MPIEAETDSLCTRPQKRLTLESIGCSGFQSSSSHLCLQFRITNPGNHTQFRGSCKHKTTKDLELTKPILELQPLFNEFNKLLGPTVGFKA